MKKPTYIFGHINPDTDSICSAIAYGELKKELGDSDVEVYRLGSISKETKFVLEYFNIPIPKLLRDVKPQLSDLQYYEPVTVSKECSLNATWQIMKSSGNSRIVAIVDESGKLKGIASVGDLANLFMDNDGDVLEKYEISYNNIIEVTNGEIMQGTMPSESVSGKFHLDSQVIDDNDIKQEDVVIISVWENIPRFAKRCSCLIVTENKSHCTFDLKSVDCFIILTHVTSFQIISMIDQAISIGSIMRTKGIESFTLDNHIEDVIDATKTSTHRNFPVIDNEERLAGIISRRHLIDYQRKKVILIDHNESHQTVEGIENADIIEIIDHHRVANVQTQTPLFIRSEPVGATATIIFKMYMENFFRPDKNIAGIMLGAILSDTLMFNSPTCTKEDREAAYKLAKIAGIDLDDFGEQMFRESAVFDEYSAKEILAIDRKEFSFGKYRTYISQVNTIDFKSVAKRHDELINAMEEYKKSHECDLILLMITDIIDTGSEILATTVNNDLLLRAFGIPRDANSIFLPGVVSRKKQIVPLLMKAVQI